MSTLTDDIHKKLRDAVLDADFPIVRYPDGVRTTSEDVPASPPDPEIPATLVKPGTVLAKPLSATWNVPIVNRRRGFIERATWRWELIVEFSREVDLEAFETANMNTPLRIPRSGSKPQVDLILEEAEYRHPPEQQPAGGTRVVYRVRAELSPL